MVAALRLNLDGCNMMDAMCARRLGVEIRLFGRRAIDEKPADRIRDRCLSRAVRAKDVRVLAVKVDGKILDPTEVF